MTLAEEMRNSVSIERDHPNFRESVRESLLNRGKWSIICDTHITKIMNYAVPFKYWSSIEEFARREGLRAIEYRNPYGVRCIRITM